MNHKTTPQFWNCYAALPARVRDLADKCYGQLKENPQHPSLHFKRIDNFRTVRVGLHYRAIAIEDGETLIWFWIGTHAEYDRLVG